MSWVAICAGADRATPLGLLLITVLGNGGGVDVEDQLLQYDRMGRNELIDRHGPSALPDLEALTADGGPDRPQEVS